MFADPVFRLLMLTDGPTNVKCAQCNIRFILDIEGLLLMVRTIANMTLCTDYYLNISQNALDAA